MKRMIAVLFGTTMLLAAFAVTSASADPGPNGNNDKGLCTAYFNGQKTGHDKQAENDGESPGPFGALEQTARDAVEDTEAEIATLVYTWCQTLAGIAGEGIEIGGQPNQNGRWECTQEGEEYSCTSEPEA